MTEPIDELDAETRAQLLGVSIGLQIGSLVIDDSTIAGRHHSGSSTEHQDGRRGRNAHARCYCPPIPALLTHRQTEGDLNE